MKQLINVKKFLTQNEFKRTISRDHSRSWKKS